jgi:transcriptional regulator of acetoin/glycerol metabolism
VAQAARQLGMSRQALYRRMEKLGIKESPTRQG